MRLDIHFRHMDRSESLENFATEKITHSVDGFAHRHDVHVQAWLISELNKSNRGAGSFICEIEIRYPKKKQYFIQKQSPDMHTAIQMAADKLKVLVDEAGKREIDFRHDVPVYAAPDAP
jgi:ribosome-associated translation inhibitor RaiA